MKSDGILDWLRENGTPEGVAALSRYGIRSVKAFGVPMGVMKKKAKSLGRSHATALALWKTGFYEARTMAVFLADADKLTSGEADQWCAEFDNWAICDTACFSLLDRTPYRWDKVPLWCNDDREFVRRAGFALIWSMTTHDKRASNEQFEGALALVTLHADDERHLVKKAIDMALRAIGKRNPSLHASALKTCATLSAEASPSARWIGSHANRELTRVSTMERLGKS